MTIQRLLLDVTGRHTAWSWCGPASGAEPTARAGSACRAGSLRAWGSSRCEITSGFMTVPPAATLRMGVDELADGHPVLEQVADDAGLAGEWLAGCRHRLLTRCWPEAMPPASDRRDAQPGASRLPRAGAWPAIRCC